MAEKGSSWGMQLAVLGAWGLGLLLAVKLLQGYKPGGNLMTGPENSFVKYGSAVGVAVAAGQVCGKYPGYDNCDRYITDAMSPSSSPLGEIARQFFIAGLVYPNEANPYALPQNQYIVRDGRFAA
jgi:hypothetical protein